MRRLPALWGILLAISILLCGCGATPSTSSPAPPEGPTEISASPVPTEVPDSLPPTPTLSPDEPVETKITLDGDPSDWAGYEVLISDPKGDHQRGGFDISNVKAITNDKYLYVLIETHAARQDYVHVDLELDTGARQFVVSIRAEEGGLANMGEVTTGNWVTIGEVVGSASADGEAIEFRMPLSVIDYTTALTLVTVRPMAGSGGQDWYAVDETSPVEVLIVNEYEPTSSDGEVATAPEQRQVCASEIVPPIPFGELDPAPFQFSRPGYAAEWFVAPGAFNMPHEIMLTP